LHCGHIAELAAAFAFAGAVAAKAQAFGFQQSLVESGEVQALAAVLLGAHVAAGTHEIGLGGIAEILDFGEKIGTGEHG